MSLITVITIIAVIYIILYLLDTGLKTNQSYVRMLRSAGLEIGLFSVRWSTTRFNSSLHWVSQLRPGWSVSWFRAGAVVTSILVLPSMILLSVSVIQHLHHIFRHEDSEGEEVMLQPVLPGVNLPSTHLLYYFTSLAMASLFHEAGHAVAGFSVNIRMVSAGLMVLAVFPAAYVELPTDQLMARAARHQLTVFSAGVWHNIVLAAAAWSLSLITPLLLAPVYSTGVTVVTITPDSVVSGPSGLVPGDLITRVQGRPVNTVREFKIVLAEVISHPQQGLCVSDSIIKNLEVVNQTGSDLCFKNVIKNSQSCPPIRKLITEAKLSLCPCSDQSECWTPEISTNHSKLVIIQRQDKLEYLYLGNPAFIYMDTVLSDYHPHYSWIPASLPDIIITLLLYTAAFSGGLAVLNVVPSYLLGELLITIPVNGKC